MPYRAPVFVINLDRSPERLAFMRAQAARVGFHFERVRAVDGLNLPRHLAPQFLTTDGLAASAMTAGEIGCAASHLGACELVRRHRLAWAIVLEDDVAVDRDVLAAARGAVATAPEGWDFIHLSSETKRSVLRVAALPNGRHLIRYSRMPIGMGGYVISNSGAQKLLATSMRVRAIDQEIRYAWLTGLDVLGVYPAPVGHAPDFSTTMQERRRKIGTPGALSAVRGWAYRVRKLGPYGYLACSLRNLSLRVGLRSARLVNGYRGSATVWRSRAGPAALRQT